MTFPKELLVLNLDEKYLQILKLKLPKEQLYGEMHLRS